MVEFDILCAPKSECSSKYDEDKISYSPFFSRDSSKNKKERNIFEMTGERKKERERRNLMNYAPDPRSTPTDRRTTLVVQCQTQTKECPTDRFETLIREK